MKYSQNTKTLVLSVAMAVALVACRSNETKPEATQTEAAPASQPAAQPAASQPAPASAASQEKPAKNAKGGKTSKASKASKDKAPAQAAPAAEAAHNTGPYDLSKNKPVTDSTKVEAGQGTTVKGINDWEGEITGIPAANSKFTKLKIGMPMQQAFDMVGQPTDQGAYVTAKAFIPFYFGSDRARWEAVYKGQGRLIFATQAGFGTSQYLVWIIHNSNEPGYR